jgi:hypothetical protein
LPLNILYLMHDFEVNNIDLNVSDLDVFPGDSSEQTVKYVTWQRIASRHTVSISYLPPITRSVGDRANETRVIMLK